MHGELNAPRDEVVDKSDRAEARRHDEERVGVGKMRGHRCGHLVDDRTKLVRSSFST